MIVPVNGEIRRAMVLWRGSELYCCRLFIRHAIVDMGMMLEEEEEEEEVSFTKEKTLALEQMWSVLWVKSFLL